MKRKAISLGMSVVMTAGMLAGVSPMTFAADEVELNFPTYWCKENVGAVYFEAAVERFNQQYEGTYQINIEEVVEDTFNDKLSQMAQSGQLPALIGGMSADFVNQVLIPNGLYTPMNDFLEENPQIKALCVDSSLSYCTQENGDIVGMPLVSLASMGTFYNTQLYQPDKPICEMSVDEFTTSLGDERIAFQTVDNAWTSMLFLTALIANEEGGAKWLQANDGSKTTDFNQEFVISALEKLGGIWKSHASDNAVGAAYADAANAFCSGQAAIICNGSWMNSMFRETGKDNWSGDFDGNYVKADYYPGNIAICNTRGYGRYVLTNAGTEEERECAKTFLQFIYSQEELESFTLTEGGQIPNMEYSEEFMKKLQEDPIAADQTTLVTEKTTIVPSLGSIMYDSVANDVFANDLVQFVNGAMDAEQFAEDLSLKSAEAADH